MDVSISVFVLMFLRDFIYVNNCKIYFKNFNVLRDFLYYNVKKGGSREGRNNLLDGSKVVIRCWSFIGSLILYYYVMNLNEFSDFKKLFGFNFIGVLFI